MKKMVFLLALIVLCGLFAGCHGSEGRKAFVLPETFDESRQYEVVFWAKNDTNQVQAGIYRSAIAEFEKLYPNITVKLRMYTDYGQIYNDVITNIVTDTTPNVCISYPDHIATYLTGDGTVVGLDDLFEDETYGLGGSALHYEGPKREEMVEDFLEECSFGGSHYAVPYMRSTEALYLNKDYVEKLGYTVPDVVTWDFIWEVSDAAMKKNADGTYFLNGGTVMIPFIYKSTDNMMIQRLAQMEAPYSTAEGEIGIFSDQTKSVLYEVADHAAKRSFSTFKISSYPANFLNAGQCVFAVDSTAGSTWMGSEAPLLDIAAEKIVPFTTEVRMVPQVDPAHPKMISQGPSLCLFNKDDPQEVLASWIFLQYLLTNDVQIPYAETEGYVPVTKKAQNDPAYQAYLADPEEYAVKREATALLLAHTEDTFVTPVFNGSASLRDAAGQLIENVTKSVRRGETVDEAYMQRLFSDVSSLYRLDQITFVASAGTRQDLGPLPRTAVSILVLLGVAWAALGAAYLASWHKKRSSSDENA